MQVIFIVLVLVYMAGVISLANQLDAQQRTVKPAPSSLVYPYSASKLPMSTSSSSVADGASPRGVHLLRFALLFLVALLILNGMSVLLSAVVPPEAVAVAGEATALEISFNRALAVLAICVVAAGLSVWVVLSGAGRAQLAKWLGNIADFDANAYVHQTALVLAIVLLAYTTIDIILVGGVEGLAESLETQQIGVFDAVLNVLIMPTVALLGVGILTRRTWGAALVRLGLRFPTRDDLVYGVGMAVFCLALIVAFASVLSLFIPPEVLEEQSAASQQIARAFGGSLMLAFLAAFSAAVGEEILFRGALQPIFGLVPTTIFFALLHSQYALTPASAAIVLVGGAFGWLRQRYSTTAAIIAHFIYNFVQLALVALVLRLEEAGMLPEVGFVVINAFISIIPGLS